jgi:hypothetical protein
VCASNLSLFASDALVNQSDLHTLECIKKLG